MSDNVGEKRASPTPDDQLRGDSPKRSKPQSAPQLRSGGVDLMIDLKNLSVVFVDGPQRPPNKPDVTLAMGILAGFMRMFELPYPKPLNVDPVVKGPLSVKLEDLEGTDILFLDVTPEPELLTTLLDAGVIVNIISTRKECLALPTDRMEGRIFYSEGLTPSSLMVAVCLLQSYHVSQINDALSETVRHSAAAHEWKFDKYNVRPEEAKAIQEGLRTLDFIDVSKYYETFTQGSMFDEISRIGHGIIKAKEHKIGETVAKLWKAERQDCLVAAASDKPIRVAIVETPDDFFSLWSAIATQFFAVAKDAPDIVGFAKATPVDGKRSISFRHNDAIPADKRVPVNVFCKAWGGGGANAGSGSMSVVTEGPKFLLPATADKPAPADA